MLYRDDIVETGAAAQVTEGPEHARGRRPPPTAPVPDPGRRAWRRAERLKETAA
ncbi:hypothetical protein AB0B12_21915 [Streptomyces sp. NPDC044780]|uniref:Uncharacterized protein n=1 Tax=Streptomyces luomodiensis TaxID=3026192 RepID=A0ABY9UR77_9ACTN|nr:MULTISPECIES: hypothetical protein [unclassified Streptomyces]WAP53888.1 hypothetical protein N6H00_02365 [Streptomyces sp. S465]WNE94349.1 hypothetical protein PS467_02920 [Streptomyces sp. SCA4-21]